MPNIRALLALPAALVLLVLLGTCPAQAHGFS
jgi:hypothetical protein